MSDLVTRAQVIPAMSAEAIDIVRQMERVALSMPQQAFLLDRQLHHGMYARTVTLPPGYWGGTVVNKPCFVVVVGDADFYAGPGELVECRGVRIIKAGAPRKQGLMAYSTITITAISCVDATTVDDADLEMSGEPALLREGC